MTAALPEKIKEEAQKRIPLNSFGTPDDIAEVVAFFASDKTRYITGQFLNVDGGLISSW